MDEIYQLLNLDFDYGEFGFWIRKGYCRNDFTLEEVKKVIEFNFTLTE